MKLPQVVEDLLAAREVLVCHGWTRGELERDGRYCAVGALDKILPLEMERDYVARQALQEIIGGSIVQWNDARGRTKAQVIAAFDQAASLALSEAEHLATGPFCRTCGAGFKSRAGNLPCSKPTPGREYVDVGRGGHVFDMKARP